MTDGDKTANEKFSYYADMARGIIAGGKDCMYIKAAKNACASVVKLLPKSVVKFLSKNVVKILPKAIVKSKKMLYNKSIFAFSELDGVFQ